MVTIRLGTVMSAAGGALKKMLLPFKLWLGAVVGSGGQYVNWVSIADAGADVDVRDKHGVTALIIA